MKAWSAYGAGVVDNLSKHRIEATQGKSLHTLAESIRTIAAEVSTKDAGSARDLIAIYRELEQDNRDGVDYVAEGGGFVRAMAAE